MKNMKKWLLSSVLLAVCNLAVYSQGVVVSGFVKDSLTNEVLPGATVVVDFRKKMQSTSTDENGHFSIVLSAGQHILTFRYIGYSPASFVVDGRKQKVIANIMLSKVSDQLEQVVVTNKGTDKNVRQAILGASQINIKTMEKMPSAFGEIDLLRSIQMLPGVSSVGEASNGVNIRGGTTDQNLILMDGTPIFNPTHMFGLFSVFPPDAVSNLDLYKGNVPARYGGRAASVMDISLKNPNLEEFKLTGGMSLVSTHFLADVPIIKGKLGIYIAARGAFNDFLLPLASDQLSNIKSKFGETVTKIFWRINSKNTLTALGYFSEDYFKTDLLANLPNVIGVSTNYQHQTLNGMMRFYHVISPKLDWQTTAIIANYAPKIATTESTGNDVKLASNLLQKEIKSNLNYHLSNHKIESGVVFTQYEIKPGTLLPGNSPSVNYITTPTEHANELGWYIDDEFDLSKKLGVSAGLRYSYFMAMGAATVRQYNPAQPRDEFSVVDSVTYGAGKVMKTYGGFEPRLGLRYSITANSSIKFGYNLMRQYIQVVSNTTTPIPTSRWKTSDEHIEPQISNLFSLGYYQSMPDNIYEFSLEAYYRATQNVIDYKAGADFLLQKYPETQLVQGESKAYGIETMLSKKKGKVKGWVNYTYARTLNRVTSTIASEEINNGNWYAANYDRPHSFNSSIDITIDRHNSFGFNFVYSTGRPYTQPEGFVNYQNNIYPIYDTRNNARIPDYHRLDFSWNIYNPTLSHRKWQGHWAFTVYNVYAHKNVYSVFFKTDGLGNTSAYKLSIFAAPIPTLSYSFDFK